MGSTTSLTHACDVCVSHHSMRWAQRKKERKHKLRSHNIMQQQHRATWERTPAWVCSLHHMLAQICDLRHRDLYVCVCAHVYVCMCCSSPPLLMSWWSAYCGSSSPYLTSHDLTPCMQTSTVMLLPPCLLLLTTTHTCMHMYHTPRIPSH